MNLVKKKKFIMMYKVIFAFKLRCNIIQHIKHHFLRISLKVWFKSITKWIKIFTNSIASNFYHNFRMISPTKSLHQFIKQIIKFIYEFSSSFFFKVTIKLLVFT